MITFQVGAQNLVPNPSFEEHNTCPDIYDQMSLCLYWNSFRQSPDYLNSCDTNNFVSVPNNIMGYQLAADGEAYAGFHAFSDSGNNSSSSTYREYIGAKLISPLIVGVNYSVSLNVSWTTKEPLLSCRWANNKLGILFTTHEYSKLNPVPILNYAHVYTDSIITDSVSWVPINGSFVADSAYNYIVIGNFFNDVNTNAILINPGAQYNLSYYYVDAVKVVEDTATEDNIWILPKSKIHIYPNPCKGSFFISNFPLGEIKQVVIGNLLNDKRILEYRYTSDGEIECPTKGLSSGIYFIEVTTSKGILKSKLFLNP